LTIEAAYVGFVVALLGAGGVVAWAVANFLKVQLKTLNDLVGDLRNEVKELRTQDQDKEHEIRTLLKQSAEIPRLELKIEKQNSEIIVLRKDFEDMKLAREQREVELSDERKKRVEAEGRLTELQTVFVKEHNEWTTERGKLNGRISELEQQQTMMLPRLDTVEAKLGTNELPKVPDEPEELRPAV
jgi:predicted  nucleic acid-binding Zn-ribbon protein